MTTDAHDVHMEFERGEEMAAIFGQGSRQMEDLMMLLRGMAGELENGALLGRSGDILSDAFRTTFVNKVSLLRDKLNELESDVRGAIADLRDGDVNARSRFSD